MSSKFTAESPYANETEDYTDTEEEAVELSGAVIKQEINAGATRKWKRKEMNSPLNSLEGTRPCKTSDF